MSGNHDQAAAVLLLVCAALTGLYGVAAWLHDRGWWR